MTDKLRSDHGSYGQGKWRKVGENQSTGLAKMQKRIWTVVCRLNITVQNFFHSLRLQIIYVSTCKFVWSPLFVVWSQAIENRHWYFAWTN